MTRKFGAVAAVLLSAGCSTGVVSIGPDTFMVAGQSATGFSTGGAVMVDLYREAAAYCTANGRNLLPVNMQSVDGVPGRAFASGQLQFRCLAEGDPELRRPTMQPVPSTIIEDRRR